MDKEQMKEVIKPHKEHLTSTKEWDAYATIHKLPLSSKIIYCFNTWNEAKKELSLDIQKKAYTLEELKVIALEHKEFFKSRRMWDEYSHKNHLPSPNTFINAFGKWDKVKEFLGIQHIKRKREHYTKEEIEEILKKNQSNFLNRKQWDEYAKENKLPTYKTIKKHFTYDELLKILSKKKSFNFTKEELIHVAKDHKNAFMTKSMKEWDKYSADHSIPSSYHFSKAFGSWRKAKSEIVMQI